jgi:hypothetical protein
VVEVRGSVVTVPLVGWVPLHPPDAAHDCASFALHCNVARVPMTMLLFVAASVTAGFAAALAAGSVGAVWTDDDCPQAANADNAAHPRIPRNKREAVGLRPTNFIRCFPCDLRWR